MTEKTSKRARTDSSPGGDATARSPAADVVTVRFVGEKTRDFQYIRSGIVPRVPSSIFAHHFGPGGLNEGKSALPAVYTLDRNVHRFRRHIDPYLRGGPAPSWDIWQDLSPRKRKRLRADVEFYGLPEDFIPSRPGSLQPLIPRLPVYVFGGALQKIQAVSSSFEKSAAHDGKTGKLAHLVPPFIIRSPSSIKFKIETEIYWNGQEGGECVLECSSFSLCRIATYPHDPEECTFWASIKGTVPKEMWISEPWKHLVLFRGEKLKDVFERFIKQGDLIGSPELGGLDTYPNGIVKGSHKYAFFDTLVQPYIAFSVASRESSTAKFAVDLVYMDEETAKHGQYPALTFAAGVTGEAVITQPNQSIG
ncbi:hypothetical protein DFJ74DRAFT_647981 [Hyaloraphidium curvatum]|nr:hypothetical protein DFJ74DRAFT_647981 [Hyaloraphidium curvatum]